MTQYILMNKKTGEVGLAVKVLFHQEPGLKFRSPNDGRQFSYNISTYDADFFDMWAITEGAAWELAEKDTVKKYCEIIGEL